MSEATVVEWSWASAAPGPERAASGRQPVRAVVIAVALVAAGLQVLRLTRPNALLSGGSFDTSVWLGSAIRLVHGQLPYRDFALVAPPGLSLVLSPFGFLSEAVGSRLALMALTLSTPLLAAANVLLVGRLIGHRGWRAALAACGLMAVYPAMYEALIDGMLEPILDLLCLLGAVLLFDGDRLARRLRILLAGLAFGVAGSVVIVAIVPVVVVALLLARHPRRRLLPFAGGVAAGFVVPGAAFFAASPGTFFQDVVAAQLARAPGSGRTSASMRLADMTFGAHGGGLAGAALALLAFAAVVVLGFMLVRRRLTSLEWFAIGGTVTMGATQFAIANYYPHYSAMLIPYPALLLGLAVGRLSPRWWPRLVPAVTAMAVVGLMAAQGVAIQGDRTVDWGPVVDAVVPPGGCSLASHTQLVVQGDRFQSPVAGCTAMVDPYGTRLAFAAAPAGAVSAYRAALDHTDYLVLDTSLRRWLGGRYAPLDGYISDHFRLHRSGRLSIYVRDGFRVA